MPNVKHLKEDEPKEDIIPDEEPTDSPDTGKDISDELFDGESDKDNTDLDLEEVKPDPNVYKQKQIDAWLGKILNKEATVDDLPVNLKWLKTPLLKELKALEVAPDIEAIVEKKIREKEDAMQFEQMKASLQSVELSKDKKAELSAEFKDLISAGVEKTKALNAAMKIAGIKLQTDDREDLRSAMSIPKGGGTPKDLDENDPKNILKTYKTSKERIEHWERIRKGVR